MRACCMMYHDILAEDSDADASGFRGAGPALYKIGIHQFREHIGRIAAFKQAVVISDENLLKKQAVFLTFDDGGCGAMHAADVLEQHGSYGHFFVTTDCIGKEHFLSECEIKVLYERGHVIGSHSCSHPERMNTLSDALLKYEWDQSVKVLTAIIGAPVTTASVPAGYYSRRVALAAEQAGMQFLFTSEPVNRVSAVGNCKILGRYTINRSTSLSDVSGLIQGKGLPALKQYLFWNTKKVIKKIGGNYYLRLRKELVRRCRGFEWLLEFL